MSEIKKGYGAVMGRFQTPYLHEGHKATINKVLEKHENLIICVGVHAGQNSSRNPLDFRTRQLMIQAEYPEAIILPIPDIGDDHKWSENLDKQIGLVVPPMTSVTLYGSRDSFIPYYTGKIKTVELESPDVFISATSIREEVIEKALNSLEFRAGVMYAMARRFPSPYATVDLAVVREGKLLLVQKPLEDGWRFCGGFGDNEGENGWEDDAIREGQEELGDKIYLDKDSLTYIKSLQVNDWRYKATKEKIKTTFYMIESPSGEVDPRDDIKYAKWVPFEELHKENIETVHQPLMNAFLTFLNKKK